VLPDYPIGMITPFTGAIVDIPSGWVLCDGTNGTPDLRDKFIVGAGTSYAVDAVGGSVNHQHDFTGDGHDHGVGGSGEINFGDGKYDLTDTAAITGTTDLKNGLPPYFAKAFIIFTGV